MSTRKKSQTPTKRKMSEMIIEMAAGFVGVGDTIGERQNRLNAACTAWNIACESPEVRQRHLEQFKESYLQFNPATSPTDLSNIIKDIELLIERKLKMFPDDRRQIVRAQGSQRREELPHRSRVGNFAVTGGRTQTTSVARNGERLLIKTWSVSRRSDRSKQADLGDSVGDPNSVVPSASN